MKPRVDMVLRTTRGNVTISPEQIAGCKPCSITTPQGQVIEGTEILISIGAMPGTVPEVMRLLADKLEQAQRPSLVQPVDADALPPLPELWTLRK